MNNEPVAWIIVAKMSDCDDNFIWNTGNYPDWQVKHWIPLYTHPVKELTDEDEYWLMVEVLRAKVKEQQAEIEALKAENKKYEKHIAIGYLEELKK